jgi:hypothetical protein
MDRLMADLENGDVDLDKRLKAMGIDPKEFKADVFKTMGEPTSR